VQDAATKAGLTLDVAELSRSARCRWRWTRKPALKVMRLMEALTIDDVQNVYSSLHITEEMANAMAES
jgi:transcriptional/translational regulatory protein YebC/TACO1